MKVDLGCGNNKQPGYIGIDRFKTPDVSIVCDINEGILLDDNSVEYMISSHSLEHVENLMNTMNEIYRVCKNKAVVCIVAPYYYTSLNMANPFHKQVFNEHTPRFFSKHNNTIINPEDYRFPHAKNWGLGESDNSCLNIDFRCLKMEFFYFPEYRTLSEDEKRRLRTSQVNVVDQIMYQLLVVKEPISDEEVEYIAKNAVFEEPQYVTIRRLVDSLDNVRNMCQSQINNLKLEQKERLKNTNKQRLSFIKYKKQIKTKYESLKDRKDKQTKLFSIERKRLIKTIEKNKDEISKNYTLKINALENEKNEINKKYTLEIRTLIDRIKVLEDECIKRKNAINEMKIRYDFNSLENYEAASVLIAENHLLKNRKSVKMADRLKFVFRRTITDYSQVLNNDARELLEANLIQTTFDLNAYSLGLTDFLKKDDIFYYIVDTEKDGWSSIEIVISKLNSYEGKDILAMEILTLDEKILRTVFVNSNDINHNKPTLIRFDPIINSSNQKFIIRFMGNKESDNFGMRLYEWQKYKWSGRKIATSFFGKLCY